MSLAARIVICTKHWSNDSCSY